MGVYDTPANIDYILNLTGYDKISYVGHSEGTSQIMSGGSLIPEYYNEKMKVAFFLAPPAAMSHNSVPLFELLAKPVNRKLIMDTADLIHLWDLLPYDFLNTGVAYLFCNLFDGKLCNLFLNAIADADPAIDNTSRYDVYMSDLPAGSGYKDILHYGQLISLDKPTFRRLDLGEKDNLKKYGQSTPPDYDMSTLRFPIAIMSG